MSKSTTNDLAHHDGLRRAHRLLWEHGDGTREGRSDVRSIRLKDATEAIEEAHQQPRATLEGLRTRSLVGVSTGLHEVMIHVVDPDAEIVDDDIEAAETEGGR
ncbi:hypothetical protein DJ83_11140 [Halorubrum ezzemoulense]|uniref:Uncharacterized protein n=1 Tax=Halorubrum ezzemoulense TaxID=337243 RepID=A0A256ITG0_HALEZ|nr:hypothetical protein [Halorubrum ezzemoulense]OYR59840.1 hypothetical protein DJ83_11140 [Halorubrum ezzemoulense]